MCHNRKCGAITCLTSLRFIVWNPNCWSIDIPFLFLVGTLNFALRRPASQSSTLDYREAGLAVDGNVVEDHSSCTAKWDSNPWWKVQLAYPVWVTHVELTNRIDFGEYAYLFNNFHINNSYLCPQLKSICWRSNIRLRKKEWVNFV